MLIFRALFWIIAVSLLLAGGNGVSGNYGDRPGSEYVDRDSPAYHSAARVVASVSQLNGWCLSHETACAAAGTTGQIGLELIDSSMKGLVRWAASSEASTSEQWVADQNHDDDQNDMALQGQRTSWEMSAPEDNVEAPFFDGLTDLLYGEDEELDDIG